MWSSLMIVTIDLFLLQSPLSRFVVARSLYKLVNTYQKFLKPVMLEPHVFIDHTNLPILVINIEIEYCII